MRRLHASGESRNYEQKTVEEKKNEKKKERSNKRLLRGCLDHLMSNC
jgi:hypothetical protein